MTKNKTVCIKKNKIVYTKKIKNKKIKSRDITLPTKVRLVKAMVFPVVMYGFESWTVKKAGKDIVAALYAGVVLFQAYADEG